MMKMQILKTPLLLLALLLCLGGSYAATAIADDHLKGNWHLERGGQHSLSFLESADEGNETTGQIAAWLLAGANLTIVLSILIRWINRFVHLWPKLKGLLSNFNRFQKKHLLRLHYYLNPIIMGVALWHWFESHCKSTALPEWGVFLMVFSISSGILIKFRLCPQSLRKTVHQLHTQPFIFIALILVLTVGHAIVD